MRITTHTHTHSFNNNNNSQTRSVKRGAVYVIQLEVAMIIKGEKPKYINASKTTTTKKSGLYIKYGNECRLLHPSA